MCLAIEAVASDQTFSKPCWQGYKGTLFRYELLNRGQLFVPRTLVRMPPGNYAYHRSQVTLQSQWNGLAHKHGQLSRRRSKRRLTFITSPRPRGNETSSPGKAPRPFPLRCCAIEERVWLRKTTYRDAPLTNKSWLKLVKLLFYLLLHRTPMWRCYGLTSHCPSVMWLYLSCTSLELGRNTMPTKCILTSRALHSACKMVVTRWI